MNEILYQVVAIDSNLIKDCPDKVNFISQRENMSDGILYNDYDFKNHRYIRSYVSNNFNIYDRLEEKDKQLDKYKLILKALHKHFTKHEEYENNEFLRQLENCTENDMIWLKRMAEDN